MKTVTVDTHVSTDGSTLAGGEAGSVAPRPAPPPPRRVACCSKLASQRLDAAVAEMRVAKGVVSVGGDTRRSVTYAELVGDGSFNRKFEQVSYNGGIELPRKNPDNAIPKRRDDYRIVGTRVPRPDIAEKVRGTYRYVQHVRLPGMLHGRVVLPRGQGAHAISQSDDRRRSTSRRSRTSPESDRSTEELRRRRGRARVGRRPRCAAGEGHLGAVREGLPGHEGLFDSFRSAKTDDLIDTDAGDVDAALARAAHVITSTYRGPYQSHGTMAPNCAVADVTTDAALIMCSSQAIFDAHARTRALARPPGREGPRAVLRRLEHLRRQLLHRGRERGRGLSQEVGRPVRLQLSREDELGWDNYGPALLSDVRAGVDANGKLVAFEYRAWTHATAGSRRRRSSSLDTPPATGGFGRPRKRGRLGFVPGPAGGPVLGPPIADGHVRRAQSPDR